MAFVSVLKLMVCSIKDQKYLQGTCISLYFSPALKFCEKDQISCTCIKTKLTMYQCAGVKITTGPIARDNLITVWASWQLIVELTKKLLKTGVFFTHDM